MAKFYKQVSTGLTLKCTREDVIAQYDKYPDQYIPIDEETAEPRDKKVKK